MVKKIAFTALGFLMWWLIAAALMFTMAYFWPAYSAIENPPEYTTAMLLARQDVSAIASVLCGVVVVLISKNRAIAWYSAWALFAVFLPMHVYGVWHLWPVWYHALFLIPLVPIVGFSGRLVKSS